MHRGPGGEGDERVEGEGKVSIRVEGTPIEVVSTRALGVALDVSSLAPGSYRVRVEARYGDGTRYDNRSASAQSVFTLASR